MKRARGAHPREPGGGSGGPRGKGQAFADRHWSVALAALFLFSLAWRWFYVQKLVHTPVFDYFEADARIYWQWAALIRASGGATHAPFFLAPLYPYVLAAFQAALGTSPAVLFFAQAWSSAFASVLLADATRRSSSAWPAIVVGLSVGAYGPSVLFDGLVLSESLLFFLGSALVWVVVRIADRPARVRTGLLVGALIGLMALGRATALLLLIPVGAALLRDGPQGRGRFAPLLAAMTTIVLLATPVAVHHWRLSREFIPYTYNLGYNLYIGNGPAATGSYVSPTGYAEPEDESGASAEGGSKGDGRAYLENTKGLRLSVSESSRYWFSATAEYVRRRPLLLLGLTAYKVGLMVNARELPQIEGPSLYNRLAGPLGLPIVGSFAFLGLCGLCGLLIGLRRSGAARTLAGMAGVVILGTAVFFVTDRYRLHVVPPLAPLAGIALAEIGGVVVKRDPSRAIQLAVAVVMAAVLVFLPLVPNDPAHDQWEQAATMGEIHLAKAEYVLAARELDRAIELQERGELLGIQTPMARVTMASVLQGRGAAAILVGDSRSAITNLAKAVQLAPDARRLRAQFGAALALGGDVESARTELASHAIEPSAGADLLLDWAVRYETAGAALPEYRALWAATALCPRVEKYEIPFVRELLLARRYDEADARLEAMRGAGLDTNVYWAHRAWLLAARGDQASARSLVERLRGSGALADPRVAGTLELMERPLAVVGRVQ